MNDIGHQYEIDRLMSSQDIVLAYRDVITEDIIQQLLDLSELKLAITEEDKRLRKRVFNVLVECLQNVANHGYRAKDAQASILLISQTPQSIFVRTGNMVTDEALAEFEKRVVAVNSLNSDTLRQAYNARLSQGELSQKGGAGLGLLDMFRKSGNPISYSVRRIEDGKSFLTITVRIDRE